jgi:hypothetical protein
MVVATIAFDEEKSFEMAKLGLYQNCEKSQNGH